MSRAFVSVKIMRVEGKSKSSASGERESEVSEGRVYSNEGSVGAILEYRGMSSRVYAVTVSVMYRDVKQWMQNIHHPGPS